MTHPASSSLTGLSVQADGSRTVHRALPEEVAVAIVFNGSTQAVMMASPTDLADFAHGFALSEGVITDLSQIENFELVDHPNGLEARFWLAEDRAEAIAARRRLMAGPVGCGLCGIDSLEQADRDLPQVGGAGLRFSYADIAGATDALRNHQPLHDLTHATHAAGFLQPGKGIILAREDVGRHNALDKVIGALALAGIDPASGAFVMTSRLSIELVQKTAVTRAPVLIAVSAPTAYALRAAKAAGITLVAFARGGGFDIYSHPKRIIPEVPNVP
ncbi:formate dehydrogenase accessory sulfurtransferase FdhD (plasmid) [Pseudorhodobacter turbinis]|uniref:Sulfur carrier protein FdhD n=1 Tax=Pseudorhodobacter turbinis TaxID=2500533 RepID=A0A4P8EKQ7_9RHOB|nr:formate dehydrogenase accessory sulfurtransferase FdhD [Pseudorhodobacter turbinis]QCO57482.1 formate dehydrogenase accessory sulfurtransferase FdhD [Pseudorhodobacter turbinis]